MTCAKRSGFHQYPSPQVRKRLRDKGGMSKALFVYAAIAMSAATPHPTTATRFDTDSGPVGIDNRCTACISHQIEDFSDVPQATNRVIKGVGGAKLSNVMSGTIVWKWEDDNGQVHTHRIPGSYYAPQANVRLLSPQNWMQRTMSPQEKRKDTRSCPNFHDRVILK